MINEIYSRYKDSIDWNSAQLILAVSAISLVASFMVSQLVPAIAAIAGAIAGIVTAHNASLSRKKETENNLLAQYLGFIQTLQNEVERLKRENVEYRERLDHQEVSIAHLRQKLSEKEEINT